jgi:hypothetical protein
MRRLFLVALAALAPLGCGGSSDDDKSATTRSVAPESTQADGGSGQSTTGATKPKDNIRTSEDKSKPRDGKTPTTGDGTPSPGTGGQSTPSKGSSVTKKAFIAKADRVCRQYTRRVSSVPGTSGDAQATVRLYRKVANQRDRLYRSFTALAKPTAGAALLAQYVENLEKSATIANQIADAVESNDPVKAPALIESSTGLTQKNARIAVEYGFRVCRG